MKLPGTGRRIAPLAWARVLARMGRMEWRNRGGLPRPHLWRQALFSDRSGLYPLDQYHPELFLNDWEIEARLGKINPRESLNLFGDKLLFHLLLDRLDVNVRRPDLAGLVMGDQFMPLGRFATWEDATAEPLIAKPPCGSGGQGVIKLATGSPMPCAPSLLVERCLTPHSYARTIFPDAINTIRVMTARDPDNGEPFILGTAHRFGTQRSAPTDNRKKGGLVSAIDPDTGALSPAIGLDKRNRRRVYRHHPQSGSAIAGVVVAYWHEVQQAALSLARAFPAMVLVGWDFAVTPEGPVVIEGNAALPNPNLMQAHAPLLARPRTRRFFEAYGIITKERARRAAMLAGN